MIVGSGLIANSLKNSLCDTDKILIFASGVSNSAETSSVAFQRERLLLQSSVEMSNSKKMLFIYFSSCALVDEQQLKIPYYQHKHQMEQLIKTTADNFIIFRLPQLIGKSDNKNTLINYLVDKINRGETFQLWDGATRYLIEIKDLKVLLESFIFDKNLWNKTSDIANSYRYSIEEIVLMISSYLNKSANYTVLQKKDSYVLTLDNFLDLCKNKNINIIFGKNYLNQKLKEII